MSAPAPSLAPGVQAPERTFGPITRTDIVRYAAASGDFNPNHHDELYAMAAGFPSVFAHGMLQAALLGTFATDWLGVETIRRFSVRFEEQVWPGDVLTCTGVVVDVTPDDEGARVSVDLACLRQTGGTAVAGTAEFVLA